MAQRTWLITGVNSGFGTEMTERLLARGDRVAGTVRKTDSMDDLKDKYGDLLWLAHLDVTDTLEVHQVVNKAFADLGQLNVVINNAGYGLFGAAEELTDEQILHQISTNLIGPIQVVRTALPHLRARRRPDHPDLDLRRAGHQRRRVAVPRQQVGNRGFIEATMKDVAPFNIGVTIVEPGGARTGFRSGSSRLGTRLEAYDGTPASLTRGIKTTTHPSPGDPAKVARVIIDSAGQDPAPARITLGSDAYSYVHAALSERLAGLEAQRDLALSTDFPAGT